MVSRIQEGSFWKGQKGQKWKLQREGPLLKPVTREASRQQVPFAPLDVILPVAESDGQLGGGQCLFQSTRHGIRSQSK